MSKCDMRTCQDLTQLGEIDEIKENALLRIEKQIAYTCYRHGAYIGNRTVLPSGAYVDAECPRCKSEKDAEAADALEKIELQKRELEWQTKLKGSRIGKRYWNDSLDTWKASTPNQKSILELCRQYTANFNPSSGKGLFFKGIAGTGKTHLAVSITKTVMAQGYSARYYTLSQLLSGIRACYGQAATQTEDEFYEQMVDYDLLVIDEIGVKTISGDEFNTLYRVIDERYMECKCTILAANTEKTDAETLLTDRIIDRLNETSLTVVFNWDSYRGKGK